MSEQKAVPQIPEDFRQVYALTVESLPTADDNSRRVLGQIKYYIERIAALTAERDDLKRQVTVVSSCYGDLPDSVAAMIEGHEWDNKTPSEQRDWAVAQVARLSAPVSDEDGWLIERGGLCIGMECNTAAWVTFTHPQAIRFSRKQDAENMLTSLRSFGHGKAFHDCIVTGHTWVAARTTPAKEKP